MKYNLSPSLFISNAVGELFMSGNTMVCNTFRSAGLICHKLAFSVFSKPPLHSTHNIPFLSITMLLGSMPTVIESIKISCKLFTIMIWLFVFD